MNVNLFISHASEDKDAVARPLAKRLQELGVKVWLDEFELKLGDSLRASIDRGLSEARFGVVVISPHFLRKSWPQRELAALMAKETGSGAAVVLPVWHDITAQEVRAQSPLLADRLAVSTAGGIDEVARKLVEAIVLQSQRDSIDLSKMLGDAVGNLSKTSPKKRSRKAEPPDEVFVVHGHDLAARESVARFIEKVGAIPIVLNEKASKGRTILEKFEQHSNVKFSVILLTPDDAAYAVNQPNGVKFRARQNVVFEMGFFLGKLGRTGLCVMHKGEIEFPSDLTGIAYIELDSANGWRIDLAKELKSAGVRIDLNRVLE